MHIRKFYANNLPAAMRDIRKALGADAVILSTRYLTTEDEAIVVNGGRAKVEVTAVRENRAEPNPGRAAGERPLPVKRKPSRAIQPQIPECLPAGGSLRNDLLRSASAALAARTGQSAESKKTKAPAQKMAGPAEPAPKLASRSDSSGSLKSLGESVPSHVLDSPAVPKPEPLQTILRELNDLRSRLDSMERTSSKDAGLRNPAEPAEASMARRMVAKPATDGLAPRSVDGLFPEPAIATHVLPEKDVAPDPADLAPPEMKVTPDPADLVPPETDVSTAPAAPTEEKKILRAAPAPEPLSHRQPVEMAESEAEKEPCVAYSPPPSVKEPLPLPLLKFQEHLHKQGVDAALSRRILDRMRFASRSAADDNSKTGGKGARSSQLSGARGAFKLFVEAVHDFVPRRKTSSMAAEGPNGNRAPKKGKERHPHKIALIGPTGVGKTTTIAKIASHYALEKNLKVALVTLDTYRIGAVEQLRTYAKLLGVPLEVVADPPKLRQAFDRFARADLVLIDTPGHSPGDDTALDRLSATLTRYEDLEVHLVLTASLRMEETYRIMKSFEPMGYDRVIFSKLDEARRLGEILNAWIMGGFDVSYFTTGQRVPEDLEKATVDSLCKGLVVR